MLRSGEEYRQRLYSYHNDVYLYGKRIENIVEHPCISPVINCIAATFDGVKMGIPQDELFTVSPLSGKKINRHNHIFTNAEDAIMRVKLLRNLSLSTGACTHRCIGIDALNTLDIVTRELDLNCKTEYHQRFRSFLKEVQDNDLAVAACITDPKGDRSLRPSQQADPDLYLHIVDRTPKGIVVRGAKAHQGRAMAVDYTLVLPTTALIPGEEGYALAFAVPPGTSGITQIMGAAANEAFRLNGQEEDFGNASFGGHIGALVVFDDVFIPWENVFMCGEVEYTGRLLDLFVRYHRMATGGCKAGLCDVITGTVAQITKYNGVSKASHIKDKIIEIVCLAETAFSCSIAAATMGESTEDGNYIPNGLLASVGKLNAAEAISKSLTILGEISGALAATAPSVLDLQSPEIGPVIKKYLCGVEGVTCEDRIRMFRLVNNLLFGVQELV
ncbi:MAG TPA: 4-hydroxybutyryl-CoA dehydratase, partial [Firmicutes bacterium]|nr:4-hydroxybutyryl-CoA dehydratase [Bacillota bacterium]